MQRNARIWILCATVGFSGCGAKGVDNPQPSPAPRPSATQPGGTTFDPPRTNNAGAGGLSGKGGATSSGGAAGAGAGGAGGAGAGGMGASASLAGGGSSATVGGAGASSVAKPGCSSPTRAQLKGGECVERTVEFSVATNPTSIVAGSDNQIWFDDGKGNQLVQLDVQGRVLKKLPLAAGSSSRELVTGRGDAILWYTDSRAQTVTKLTKNLDRTSIDLPFAPLGLSLGEGDQLWLTEMNQAVYRVNPFDWTRKRWSGAPNSTIVVGPDHNFWFPANLSITRLMAGGDTKDFPIGENFADDICAGPDGALWFTDGTLNQIGRMEVDGSYSITRLPLTTQPGRIIVGPDGALWFTEQGAEKIGRITVNAEVTHYPTPSSNGLINDLTVGPDGSIWYTKLFTGKIGRLIPDAVE